MSILFKNCTVLTPLADGIKVYKNAFLGVNADKIDCLSLEEPAAEYDSVYDYTGKIIMPGLYNCHTHSPMVLLRGVGSDLPLDKWLFENVCPIEDRLTPEHIRAGSDLAVMEMLSTGTVAFSDQYFKPEQTAAAAGEAGLRAFINRPVQAFDPADNPLTSTRLKEAVSLYESFNGEYDGRITVDFCVHAEYTCNEAVTRGVAEEAAKRNAAVHIHLSETKSEHENCKAKYGLTPARWFDRLGVFDVNCFAAHCVYLEDDDIELFREKGVTVVHNPTSNCKLGSGIAPIHRFLSSGVNVALGTDGAASNNNLNMFEEMHLAALINNGLCCDASILKAGEIIRMATVNGAKSRKNSALSGVIAVGEKADIIAVDTNRPHLRPVLDEPALITYSAQGSDVCMTMCDGKILYKDGEYLTVDAEKTYYNLEKAVKELYNQ